MIPYTQGQVPEDPAKLPGFLRVEQTNLAQAMQRPEPFVRLQSLAAVPDKYSNGDIVYGAAGVFGVGEGFYGREAGAWVKF